MDLESLLRESGTPLRNAFGVSHDADARENALAII